VVVCSMLISVNHWMLNVLSLFLVQS